MIAGGETNPGLQGGPEVIEFSFLSPQESGTAPSIRQINYRLEGHALYRIPDTTGLRQSATTASRVLIGGVSRLRFSYLDGQGNWLSRWDSGSPGDLPAGIRLDMELDRFGVVERLFELPGDRP
jgi:type II secretion system protein J